MFSQFINIKVIKTDKTIIHSFYSASFSATATTFQHMKHLSPSFWHFKFIQNRKPSFFQEKKIIQRVAYHFEKFYHLRRFCSIPFKTSTVKVLLFVGYQFLWLSWLGQTMKFSPNERRFPLMCKLKTSKPQIQKSTDLCFFPNPRKLVSTNLRTFTVYKK